MGFSGLGSLGLWLRLRRQRGVRLDGVMLQPGRGPLLVVLATAEAERAAMQVSQALTGAMPALRILRLGRNDMPDISQDPVAAPQLLAEAQPDAILILGNVLPAALLRAAEVAQVPVVLAQIDIRPQSPWGLDRSVQRRLLSGPAMICATDRTSYGAALDLGVRPDRLRLTGPVTDIHDPLPGFEAERATLAAMLRGRHVWLATALPRSEIDAVLLAHLAALRYSHRALLVINPADPDAANVIAAQCAASGLIVARRNADEEPTADIQVQIVEDAQELGLWYRLAPLCFMGGTLSGDDAAARHPFEPAALGSAIIHGAQRGRYETIWQQLDGAAAAREVRDAAELAATVPQLSQASQMATLATNAWTVSTGGAGVALDIARPVLDLLRKEKGPSTE